MKYVITTAWFDHTEPGYWVPTWDDPSPESPPGGLAIVTELLIERHKSPVERHLQAIEAPVTDALWLTGTEGVNVEVFDEVGTLKLTHNYFDEEYVRVLEPSWRASSNGGLSSMKMVKSLTRQLQSMTTKLNLTYSPATPLKTSSSADRRLVAGSQPG